MNPNHPDPSDSPSFFNDPAQDEGDDFCESCGRDLEEGSLTTILHCRRCEPECFAKEERE